MSMPPKQDCGSESKPHGARRRQVMLATALVLAMGLVAGVPSLWTRDLWHDDEIRLTEGARELLLSEEGLVPRVNGKADLTVAPLPSWATALLWRAGAGTLSARALSVLSALVLAAVCFLAARRRAGLAGALLAPAVALTTMVLFWHVRKGGSDVFWALLFTSSMLAGHRALEGTEGRRGRWWVVCYGFAALAVLSVGLSAALLAGLAIGLYCVLGRTKPTGSVIPHLIGITVFAAVIFMPLGTAYRGTQGIAGVLAPLVQDFAGLRESVREGELLEALLATVAGLLPWIALLPGALSLLLRRRPRHGGGFGLFLTVWIAVLAVPAVLGGREGAPDYAVAVVPPLAILCAEVLASKKSAANSTSEKLVWPFRMALAISGLFVGLLLVIGVLHIFDISYLLLGKHHVCPVTDQPYSPSILYAIVPFVAVSFASVLAAARTGIARPVRRAWLLVLAVFLLGIPADLFLTPFIDAFRTARPFAQKVAGQIRAEDTLCLYRRDYDGLYNLYTGRTRIPVLKNEEQLLDRLAHPDVLVIADEKYLKRIDEPVDWSGLQVVGGHVGGHYMLLVRGKSADDPEPPFAGNRQVPARPSPE